MPKIQIDGLDYNTEDLTEEGRVKFSALQFLEQKMVKLQTQKVIFQTAKRSIEVELKSRLSKTNSGVIDE